MSNSVPFCMVPVCCFERSVTNGRCFLKIMQCFGWEIRHKRPGFELIIQTRNFWVEHALFLNAVAIVTDVENVDYLDCGFGVFAQDPESRGSLSTSSVEWNTLCLKKGCIQLCAVRLRLWTGTDISKS